LAKILLLGPDGQVGWELQRSLAPLGEIRILGRAQVDLEKPNLLRACVQECAPDVIVNAAAYTAVDRAESEPDVAMRVNGDAVRVLAEEAEKSGALLVHYSTDYVFDGTSAGPYSEEDEPNPLSVYGRTKLYGERAIQATGCKHLIFRTSWIYGLHGGNFAKTMLRLAKEREELKVVDDQVGAPTSAELIADVTALCLGFVTRRLQQETFKAYGIYHVTASGHTSWHGYAKFLVETAVALGTQLRLPVENIYPISSLEYPSQAKRPGNSRLATDKLKAVFALDMPHWQTDLRRFIVDLTAANAR
jgi:dTDP-4-dehydrorhamnose reductase